MSHSSSELVPLLLTFLTWLVLMALGVLSMLCWRKFKNLSFKEQFLDYSEVSTKLDEKPNIDKNGEQPWREKEKQKLAGKSVQPREKGRYFTSQPLPEPGRYTIQSPPPWTPKPEINVVSVQPQDPDRDEGEEPYSSSDDEEMQLPRTALVPYEPSDSFTAESCTPPSEADFLGRIYFSLQRDPGGKSMIVRLIKGEDFPSYQGEAPNVSMQIQLAPIMKKDILKTEIHEKNANPNFNEVFEFELSYDVIKKQALRFSLVYMDKYSHAFTVGEVTHPLDHLEQEHTGILKEEMIVCREIQKLKKEKGRPRDLGFGQVLFSLMYMPMTRRLTIVVFKALDLKAATEGYPAIYAEVVMINPVRRMRKRKTTTTKSGTLCPVYNEAMAFDATNMNLPDIRLQVFLKQVMEGKPDKVMGRVVLAMNTDGLELQHWKEAMTSKKPIAYWHSLRAFHPMSSAITEVTARSDSLISTPRQIARFFSTSSEEEED